MTPIEILNTWLKTHIPSTRILRSISKGNGMSEKISQVYEHEVKDLLLLIEQAQLEAIEKTKQACWEWFAQEDLGRGVNEYRNDDEILLDGLFFKNAFEKELTPDKILGERGVPAPRQRT